MLTTNSISKGNSYQIWDSCERIFEDLNPSMGNHVKVNKNIRHVEILNDCLSGKIDEEKLVIDDYSLVIDCTVNNDEIIIPKDDLINIVTMAERDIFNFNIILDDNSLLWIIDSKSNTTVSSIGN